MSSAILPIVNSIELKSVEQLLLYDFIVPQYQRGYRWTSQQVNDLLDDLWSFQSTAPHDTFYCLQPVIVKQAGHQWELIDGQQRLTTIYILLRYLNDSIFQDKARIFSLEFATRPNSQSFLENIDTSLRDENIDYYHISAALDSVQSWFEKQANLKIVALKLYSTLLERTRVIWYQLHEDQGNKHDVFIRINSGKIPLTNAELIKALFLKKANRGDDSNHNQFERRQIEIATEWDAIETKLHHDDFWYFLNKDTNTQATRIEFIFSSLAPPREVGYDEYATFRYFSSRLNTASTEEVLSEWLRVKNRFMLFEEWFNNREWYHIIGYLITVGVPLDELVNQTIDKTKTIFKAYLTDQIRKKVNYSFDSLEYGKDNEVLKNILLLFNVEIIRQNQASGYRFPFHHYKGNGDKSRTWSLEHIHAQSDRGLNSSEKYRQWLIDVRRFVEEAVNPPAANPEIIMPVEAPVNILQLLTDLNALLERSEIDKDVFEPMQERIFTLFGEPDLHTLDNLALLTTDDNSALSNGSFPQKRARIITLEKEGSFIPIGTRNVFLKYYTPNATHLSFWTATDRDNYIAIIRTTLNDYLPRPASV
jgi:hypothetical protein